MKALKLSWCGLDGALEPMKPILAFTDIVSFVSAVRQNLKALFHNQFSTVNQSLGSKRLTLAVGKTRSTNHC
jgi:hypothetical protein